MSRPILFLLSLLMLDPSLHAAEDPAVTERFRKLVADEWQYTLRESPTFATHLGDERYNDRWPDVSLTAIERRRQHQQDVVGSSRVDLQACKLEYSIVSPK